MCTRNHSILLCTLLFTFGLGAGHAQSADTSAKHVAAMETFEASLRLHSRTELPGYTGDFDHFAVDVKGNRLFLAAEDHGTLEVFDLSTGKHLKTIDGVEAPHGILYLADKNRLVVTFAKAM